MAIVVTFDLVSNHEVTEIIGGVELTRVVRVTGLTAAPDGQLLEALRDSGVPQIFTLWPGEPWYVIRREAFPDGPNAARIVLTYGNNNRSTFNQPEPPVNDGLDVKQFSAGIQEVETTRDEGDVKMSIAPPASLAGLPNYLSTARIFKPNGTLLFERLESSPPGARVRDYLGMLNSIGLGSYPARSLLFARLDAQSDDGGRQWRCTYEFRYDPGLWKHRDRYRAPDNKVPDDAAEVTFDVQGTTDFTVLGLDFTDSQTPI